MIKEIYGKKIGMTQDFDAEGNLLAMTLLEVEPVYLLDEINYSTKNRVRIGCFKLSGKKVSKVKKPLTGYFNKVGSEAYKLIREVAPQSGADFSFLKESFQVESDQTPKNKRQVGIEDMFKEGDIVDVQAKTKGKGFAGGMKRHNWSGQPRTHGSTMHRRIGSIGASAYPSRVIKGINMPGHMGNKFRTIKNLKVLKVDKAKNILFVSGSVPGARGAVVRLRKVG